MEISIDNKHSILKHYWKIYIRIPWKYKLNLITIAYSYFKGTL